jgi:uncharacterized membrane protein
MGILYLCRRRVKQVIIDERNRRIGEKAARLTIAVYGPAVAVLSTVLIAISRSFNPGLAQAGYTLAYSAAAMVVLYDVLYYYFERKS